MNEIAEILEILDNYCGALKATCDNCENKDTVWCQKVETADQILALIERREKPMREALKEAKLQIRHTDFCYHEEKTCGGCRTVAKIDSILKEQ